MRPSAHGVKMNVSFGHGEYARLRGFQGFIRFEGFAGFEGFKVHQQVLGEAQGDGLGRFGGLFDAPRRAVAILDQVADPAHLEKRHVVQRADVSGGGAFHRFAQRAEPLVKRVAQRRARPSPVDSVRNGPVRAMSEPPIVAARATRSGIQRKVVEPRRVRAAGFDKRNPDLLGRPPAAAASSRQDRRTSRCRRARPIRRECQPAHTRRRFLSG